MVIIVCYNKYVKKEFEEIFFVCLLSVLFLFGFCTFLKTEDLISESENRSLETFEHFTAESFISGSFQDNFEAAISDQFVLSSKIRVGYNYLISKMPTLNIEKAVCENHYLEIVNSVDMRRGTLNCEDYILYYPIPLEEKTDAIEENIKRYNHLNNIADTYYYFVNESSNYDYEKNIKVADFVKLLKDNLTGDYHIDSFDFDSYNEYKDNFYKTDHHWNYIGSYKGYVDIANMLGVKSSELMKPTGEATNHEYYYGSGAQRTKNYSIKEEFVYYKFEFPEHKTWVNGEVGSYNHYADYANHEYNYDYKTNYYSYLYGEDEGEVIFDYNQPKRDNLLIVSNSFGNPIKEMIASHFNKTYVVDLRYYERKMGKLFVFSEYLKNNNIDKVLVIMSPNFVRKEENDRGLEL